MKVRTWVIISLLTVLFCVFSLSLALSVMLSRGDNLLNDSTRELQSAQLRVVSKRISDVLARVISLSSVVTLCHASVLDHYSWWRELIAAQMVSTMPLAFTFTLTQDNIYLGTLRRSNSENQTLAVDFVSIDANDELKVVRRWYDTVGPQHTATQQFSTTTNPLDRPFYQKFLKFSSLRKADIPLGAEWTEPYITIIPQRPVLAFVAPLWDHHDNFTGVVNYNFDLTGLKGLEPVIENTVTLVVTGQGWILESTETRTVLTEQIRQIEESEVDRGRIAQENPHCVVQYTTTSNFTIERLSCFHLLHDHHFDSIRQFAFQVNLPGLLHGNELCDIFVDSVICVKPISPTPGDSSLRLFVMLITPASTLNPNFDTKVWKACLISICTTFFACSLAALFCYYALSPVTTILIKMKHIASLQQLVYSEPLSTIFELRVVQHRFSLLVTKLALMKDFLPHCVIMRSMSVHRADLTLGPVFSHEVTRSMATLLYVSFTSPGMDTTARFQRTTLPFLCETIELSGGVLERVEYSGILASFGCHTQSVQHSQTAIQCAYNLSLRLKKTELSDDGFSIIIDTCPCGVAYIATEMQTLVPVLTSDGIELLRDVCRLSRSRLVVPLVVTDKVVQQTPTMKDNFVILDRVELLSKQRVDLYELSFEPRLSQRKRVETSIFSAMTSGEYRKALEQIVVLEGVGTEPSKKIVRWKRICQKRLPFSGNEYPPYVRHAQPSWDTVI